MNKALARHSGPGRHAPRGVFARFALVLLTAALLGLSLPGTAHALDVGDVISGGVKAAKLAEIMDRAQRADLAVAAGRYDDAFDNLRRMEKVANSLGGKIGDGIARTAPLSTAGVYANLGLVDAMNGEIKRFRSGAGRLSSSEEARVLRIQAICSANLGALTEALQMLDDAEKRLGSKASGMDQFQMDAVRIQVEVNGGFYEDAAKRADSMPLPADTPLVRGYADLFKASAWAPAGRKDEARDAGQRAYKIFANKKLYSLAARTAWLLGTIYSDQKQSDTASTWFERARDAASKGEDPSSLILAGSAGVDRLLQEGNVDDALKAARAFSADLSGKDSWMVSYRLTSDATLARALAAAEEWQELVDLVTRVEESEVPGLHGEQLVLLLTNGVEAAREVGQDAKADAWAAWLNTTMEGGASRASSAMRAQSELARLAAERGDTAEAQRWYRRALDSAEAFRGTVLGSVNERAQVSADHASLAGELAESLATEGRWLEALEAVERGRTRALAELFVQDDDVDAGLPLPLKQKLRTIDHDITAVEGSIDRIALASTDLGGQRGFEVSGRPAGDVLQEQRLEAQRRLSDLRDQQASLLREHRLQRGVGGATRSGLPPLDSKALAALPRPGEVLISWHVSGDTGFVVAWTSSGATGALLEGSKGELQSQIDAFRKTLDPTAPAPQASVRAAGQALATYLLAPVADAIDGATRVVLLPSGPLHYVPFAALPHGEGWLGAEKILTRAPSATLLAALRDAGGAFALTPPTVFANPTGDLPGTEVEAEGISQALTAADPNAKTTLVLGKKATPTALRKALAQPGVLHYAGHGVFERDAPTQSYLMLAKDRSGTRLTAADLQGVEVARDLVLLSGCSTGVSGAISASGSGAGDDVLSLSVAFQAAGAARVASTLWDVADEPSASFVSAVYTELLSGSDLAEALMLVRSAVTANDASAHPAHWGAWVASAPE